MKKYGYGDIAVFYRTNAQSRVLESTFTQARIPYSIVGGLRFYEREEVKDILSYIRLLLNPLDEISFLRIIGKPPRGIGSRTADAILEATIAQGRPFFQAGEEVESAQRAARVRDFCDMMKRLKEHLDASTPTGLLQEVYRQTGYSEWLKKQGREEKLHNLEELFNAVEEFARKNPQASISSFIEDVSLDLGAVDKGSSSSRESGRSPADDSGRVSLITLHNAKGLEFPVVFMAGMEEGIFPHFLSTDNPDDIQEERRLCYVGMTRAMERLFFTAARSRRLYGKNIEREISKFIREVPGELLLSFEENQLYSPRISYYAGETLPGTGDRYPRGRKASEKSREKGPTVSAGDLVVNDRVVHANFGKGTVRAIAGETATIAFDDDKVMKFMLKYTPIRKENEDGDRQ